MTDPIDVLRSHVQSVALLERPHTDPADLVAAITGAGAPDIANRSTGADRSHRSNVVALRSPRRRRWLVATGAVAAVVLGGAGVAAFRGEKPSVPSADVLCHGSLGDEGAAIAVAPTDDPISVCADLWRNGDLPSLDERNEPTTDVPRLVACTGDNGSIEVLPLPELTSCADVGLADADVVGAAQDPIVGLRDGVMTRVNSGPCRTPDDVERIVRGALADAGLGSWRVEVSDPKARCAAVALDPEASTAVVFPNPSFQQEMP